MNQFCRIRSCMYNKSLYIVTFFGACLAYLCGKKIYSYLCPKRIYQLLVSNTTNPFTIQEETRNTQNNDQEETFVLVDEEKQGMSETDSLESIL